MRLSIVSILANAITVMWVVFGTSLARAQDKLTPAELERVQWTFSSFLSGNTSHIRELINGTLEQQLDRKAEKDKRLEDDKAVIAAHYNAVGEKLRASSPAFGATQDALAVAKAQAVAARKGSDSVAMMAAQNLADQLQAQITQQEELQTAADPEVIARLKDIKATQAELKTLEPAIANAAKARDQLVEGLRITLKLPGPPAVGGRGILGRVKPTRIVDAHAFITDFEAIEITGEDKNGKAPDGFKALTGKTHFVKLMVTGVDTSKLRVGTEALFDQYFVITSTKQSGKLTLYVVAPSDTEIREQEFNYLFKQLDALRIKN